MVFFQDLIDFFIEDVASGNDHVLAISEDGNDLFSWG
jgi:alpha-tubulin suppressor-like RCC1 family protein